MRDLRGFALVDCKRWRCVSCLAVFVFGLVLPCSGVASGLETFAQALTRHHIGLTEPALIEALRNPDGEVRGLAAWQLLETKAVDSLPQILQAVRDERESRTKVNLASAAAYLGSKEGLAAVETVCHDSSVPGWVRTDAARHLFDLHDRSCLPDLWQLMDSGVEFGTRISAINLVEQLSDRTALESAQLLHITLDALNDPDISLRLFAASALGELRDTAAIPNLRTAIQLEKEEVVKSRMEDSLRSLLALNPTR
jgi:HEAT repeat protein